MDIHNRITYRRRWYYVDKWYGTDEFHLFNDVPACGGSGQPRCKYETMQVAQKYWYWNRIIIPSFDGVSFTKDPSAEIAWDWCFRESNAALRSYRYRVPVE